MLMAAAHKKIKRKLELHEDEMTSCVFGAMQHLPIDIVWRFFERMAKEAGIEIGEELVAESERPDKADFKFWPRWETKLQYVEPDLVVNFYKGEKTLLRVIVEVKWDAPLSPPCELVRQWNYRPEPSDPWVHLYLVKNSAPEKKEIGNSLSIDNNVCQVKQGKAICQPCKDGKRTSDLYKGRETIDGEWQERSGCIGWRNIVVAAGDLARRNDRGSKAWGWGEGVSMFLAKQGIVAFTGFSWLNKEELPDLAQDEERFFHRTPWFAFLNESECTAPEFVAGFFYKTHEI